MGHCGRFGTAGQHLQSQYGVYPGVAPRHIWVQSVSGRAGCAMGVGLRRRPSQLCSLLSCYDRSRSARNDGLRASRTNHSYGPSLVVGRDLVWDAAGRELRETALLSTTHGLPVGEYWTQWLALRVTEITRQRPCEPSCHMRSRGHRP